MGEIAFAMKTRERENNLYPGQLYGIQKKRKLCVGYLGVLYGTASVQLEGEKQISDATNTGKYKSMLHYHSIQDDALQKCNKELHFFSLANKKLT